MDYSALGAEIQNGPLKDTLAPLVAAGSDGGVADLLNRRPESFDPPANWTVYRPITRAEMLMVVTGLGAGPALESAAGANPAAWSLLLLVRSPESELDVRDANVRGLAPALDQVTAGLGTALVSAGTVSASCAEVLSGAGAVVSASDVAASFGRV